MYSKSFFDLQLQFARRVAAVSGLSLASALIEYTNLYIRFGLGRDFNAAHQVWREYVAGLCDAQDGGDWTYRFYLTRLQVVIPPNLVAAFGCFSYSTLGSDRIRLHFENAETDGRSPLGIERRDQRWADLAALFAHVKRTVQTPLQVIGASWLYNLPSYCRLFPSPFIATAQVLRHRFQHMPLWGQFVDRSGGVRGEQVRQFLQRLDRQSSIECLDDCFPLQVLRVEASALKFYEFYGVT